MATVGQLLEALEEIAPPGLALGDDPIGLQLGTVDSSVNRCAVALDPTLSAVEFAIRADCQALITHHALIYSGLKSLAGESAQVRAIRAAMQANLAVITAHTNWDAARGGVNDTLCDLLGLTKVVDFGEASTTRDYKLVTFVPAQHRDEVLDALSAVGCGRIGNYDRCAFLSEGRGTYEPKAGAQPFSGEVGERSVVAEERIEMVVPGGVKSAAVRALMKAHPYDEPAFDLYPLANPGFGIGRIGVLPEPMAVEDFVTMVSDHLDAVVRVFGHAEQLLTVGVIGGSGGFGWREARDRGCEALVTGEVRHHEAVEAAESGFLLIEAGHFATENPAMAVLAARMQERLPDTEFVHFDPPPGSSGRHA